MNAVTFGQPVCALLFHRPGEVHAPLLPVRSASSELRERRNLPRWRSVRMVWFANQSKRN